MVKGKMSPEQIFDRKIWRFIGYMAVCSIDKYLKERLYYVKAGKHIRVEDLDSVMCYAPISNKDLREYGFEALTIDDLQAWLEARGIKRQRQKRVKPFRSLYD